MTYRARDQGVVGNVRPARLAIDKRRTSDAAHPQATHLDPNRILDNDRGDVTADHEARAALLESALHETCNYAQHLWDDLDSMRKYLLDSLPSDPRSPGPHRASAAPSGPDDEQGWQNWIDAFAEVTSALCAPHGDSGFGLGRARQEAQLRRRTPENEKLG